MVNLLNVGKLPPALEARLAGAFHLTTLPQQQDTNQFLQEHAAEFNAVVTSAAVGVSAELIDRLPNLKVISNFGVGLDKIDLAKAHSRGIPVGYTPDVLNDCVADIAFGLMLDVARGISSADRFVRAGKWPKGALPLARKVSGANLGIVGMGRIGRTIAKRALGFDMSIRYHARRPVSNVEWHYEPNLLELAHWADFLVVITAGGAGTRHLINADVFSALGPKGFLINVARGSVVDETELIKALQAKRIAGAALDVFENEPQVPTALFEMENVVLLPHIASATVETRQAMADRVYDNLESYFKDGTLLSAADAP